MNVDVRRFLGAVNQVSKFIANVAVEITTSESYSYSLVGSGMKHSVKLTKQELTCSLVLTLFDPNYKTVVSADASCHGLGTVLTQQQPDGEHKPIVFISMSMSNTEMSYAQIEKELCVLGYYVVQNKPHT